MSEAVLDTDLESFALVEKTLYETGKNPYDVAREIRKILENYKKQDFRLVYKTLIKFCDESRENPTPRFERCKTAQHNILNCTSCPIWKVESELYKQIKNL